MKNSWSTGTREHYAWNTLISNGLTNGLISLPTLTNAYQNSTCNQYALMLTKMQEHGSDTRRGTQVCKQRLNKDGDDIVLKMMTRTEIN